MTDVAFIPLKTPDGAILGHARTGGGFFTMQLRRTVRGQAVALTDSGCFSGEIGGRIAVCGAVQAVAALENGRMLCCGTARGAALSQEEIRRRLMTLRPAENQAAARPEQAVTASGEAKPRREPAATRQAAAWRVAAEPRDEADPAGAGAEGPRAGQTAPTAPQEQAKKQKEREAAETAQAPEKAKPARSPRESERAAAEPRDEADPAGTGAEGPRAGQTAPTAPQEQEEKERERAATETAPLRMGMAEPERPPHRAERIAVTETSAPPAEAAPALPAEGQVTGAALERGTDGASEALLRTREIVRQAQIIREAAIAREAALARGAEDAAQAGKTAPHQREAAPAEASSAVREEGVTPAPAAAQAPADADAATEGGRLLRFAPAKSVADSAAESESFMALLRRAESVFERLETPQPPLLHFPNQRSARREAERRAAEEGDLREPHKTTRPVTEAGDAGAGDAALSARETESAAEWHAQVDALLETPAPIGREWIENPFPNIFPGARFSRVGGSGVMEHLEGEWQSGGECCRIIAVRGAYSPRPPAHLAGFTRFIRTQSGSYWIKLMKKS